MSNNQTPGQRVLGLRIARGLSQKELATLAALPSAAYVSRYETGSRTMRPEMLQRVAAVLGTSEGFILSGSEEPERTETLNKMSLRIHGRPKGRNTIQVYPDTADVIHSLSRAYGLSTPELMEQLINHCLSCIEV